MVRLHCVSWSFEWWSWMWPKCWQQNKVTPILSGRQQIYELFFILSSELKARFFFKVASALLFLHLQQLNVSDAKSPTKWSKKKKKTETKRNEKKTAFESISTKSMGILLCAADWIANSTFWNRRMSSSGVFAIAYEMFIWLAERPKKDWKGRDYNWP